MGIYIMDEHSKGTFLIIRTVFSNFEKRQRELSPLLPASYAPDTWPYIRMHSKIMLAL